MFRCILDQEDVHHKAEIIQPEGMAQMTEDLGRAENVTRNPKTQMETGFGHLQSQGTEGPQGEVIHRGGFLHQEEFMKEEVQRKDIIWMVLKS